MNKPAQHHQTFEDLNQISKEKNNRHFAQVVKMVRAGSKIQNRSRRVGTFSVPTRASFAPTWAKKHAHPTPVNFAKKSKHDS